MAERGLVRIKLLHHLSIAQQRHGGSDVRGGFQIQRDDARTGAGHRQGEVIKLAGWIDRAAQRLAEGDARRLGGRVVRLVLVGWNRGGGVLDSGRGGAFDHRDVVRLGAFVGAYFAEVQLFAAEVFNDAQLEVTGAFVNRQRLILGFLFQAEFARLLKAFQRILHAHRHADALGPVGPVRLGVGLDDDAIHQRLLILAEGEDDFLRELALEPGGCAAFRGIDQPGDVRLPGGEPHDGRAVGGAENV